MFARARARVLTGLGAALIAPAALIGTPAAAAVAPAAPTIAELPQLLHGASPTLQLAVAFDTSPDPTTLRAAITAASAFAGLSGRGVSIVPVIRPSRRALASSPMPVIALHHRPGAPQISLHRLPSGSPLLTLTGAGPSLVNAARLLSTRWIAAFGSSTATLSARLTATLARLADHSAGAGDEPLAAASASANGRVTLTRHVVIPLDRVISRGRALLRLGVEYNAPGGGRLTFRLNGHTIGAAQSRGAGNTFDYRFKIASVWTDGPNLQPGYYLEPGENTISITATAANRALSSQVGAQLALTPHSDLQMSLSPRPPAAQIGLWPFPLFAGSWDQTTVLTHPAARLSPGSLAVLMSALANTARLTGVPADPRISYGPATAAERRGDLLVFGNPRVVAGIRPAVPVVPGLLSEQTLGGGRLALLVTDNRAMRALAEQGITPGLMSGRTIVVDGHGHAHTILDAPAPAVFATPTHPWLKPAAGIAALVLAWILLRVFLARRRLRARPELPREGLVS